MSVEKSEKDARLVRGVLEVKTIPPPATARINEMYTELMIQRDAFAEYVKTVRMSLDIPESNGPGQMWDLSENSVYFLRLDDRSGPSLVRPPAQSAEEVPTEKLEVPEGEDAGDVCDNTYRVERPRANAVSPEVTSANS